MSEPPEPPSAFDVAAYVREMSQHLAGMCEEAGLLRVSAVLRAAAVMAAEALADGLAERYASRGNAAAEDAP